jgi:hypothetical protein
MATKVYVTNPQLVLPAEPDQLPLGYTMAVWEEGLPPVTHPPFNEDTLIFLAFGDTAGIAKQKIIDNVVAHVTGITSNDVLFIPEIGTGA